MALTDVIFVAQRSAHPRTGKVRSPQCCAWLCLVLALLAAGLGSARAKAATAPQPSSAKAPAGMAPEPISGVILADESGSETAASIAAERDAATALVQSDPSSASQFMIAGFGSQNRPGQQAATPYCNFIATSTPAARDSLAMCADHIRARTEALGWDTDHAQALEFGIDELRGRPGLKVIFLMTDGVLDVHDSPIYGRVPWQRTPEAWRIVEQQLLPEARADGIQVWPLGFGPQASYASLERFAVGGAVVAPECALRPASQPRAIIVNDLFDLVYRLVSDQATARCGSVGAPSGGNLGPGGSITLHVRIPVLASFGSLTVVAGNPQVQAAFIAPNGIEVPNDGSLDGQAFRRAGVGTDVQTLRIVNPMPGLWTLKLTTPPGLVAQTRAVAFASWEGFLSASLFTSPVQVVPGQPVDIELRILSRNGVVVGPALASLTASATISGAFGRIPVSLRLAGNNAAFRGIVALPKGTTGEVLVGAQVSGDGILGDQTSETILAQSFDFLSASFAVNVPPSVHPGSLLRGQVTTLNQGAPTRGVLRLEGFSPDALMTIAAGPIPIPTGTSRAPFTIRISPVTKLGPAFVSVVLDRGGGQTIAAAPLDMQIVAAPSWSARARVWAIPIGLALLLLAAACIVRARLRAAERARAGDTHGLTATLLVDGLACDPLSSDGGDAFMLALVDDGTPRLVHADVADATSLQIAIRRTDQSASIATGDGETRDCRFGEPISVGPRLALQVDSLDLEVVPEHRPAAVPAADNTTDGSVPLGGRWR